MIWLGPSSDLQTENRPHLPQMRPTLQNGEREWCAQYFTDRSREGCKITPENELNWTGLVHKIFVNRVGSVIRTGYELGRRAVGCRPGRCSIKHKRAPVTAGQRNPDEAGQVDSVICKWARCVRMPARSGSGDDCGSGDRSQRLPRTMDLTEGRWTKVLRWPYPAGTAS